MGVNNIVAITNRKGGSGKTTTSINLAGALALKGYQVLLIDTDPQAHSSLSLGLKTPDGAPDLYDVLAGQSRLDDVMRKTSLANLRLVAGGKRLAGYERDNARNQEAKMVLLNRISEIETHLDYLFIDTPPTLSLMTVSSLIASSKVIVPLQTHFLAIDGLAETLRLLRHIEKNYNRPVKLMGVVPTFYQPNTRLAQAILRDIRRTLGEEIILNPIRSNISLAEAPSHGKSIFQYKLKSHGAADYLKLANQVEYLCKRTEVVKV